MDPCQLVLDPVIKTMPQPPVQSANPPPSIPPFQKYHQVVVIAVARWLHDIIPVSMVNA